MRVMAAALISLYQALARPLMPPCCRFHPSCSDYAREAFLRHAAPRALLLALGRLSRCHPWSAGGIDAVPDANASPVWRRGPRVSVRQEVLLSHGPLAAIGQGADLDAVPSING